MHPHLKAPSAASAYRSGLPSFSGVLGIAILGGTSGHAESGINHTILTVSGAPLEGLCCFELLWGSGLMLRENLVQPRFHILLSFRPQLCALDRQSPFDSVHPTEQ